MKQKIQINYSNGILKVNDIEYPMKAVYGESHMMGGVDKNDRFDRYASNKSLLFIVSVNLR